MNNQLEHKNQSEEIDLSLLTKKLNNALKKSIILIFGALGVFIKYKIIVAILVIIGFAYGFYKDKTTQKIFYNKVIVIPNFGSVDYLYDKVEVLNAKVAARDSIYLKPIFGSNYGKLRKIEIEPIVDVYNFASQSRENLDIFRILFQNQELSEFVKDMTTSKYYKHHNLNFSISGTDSSEKIVNDILKYFNENEHYNLYKKVIRENTDFLLKENFKMIGQIDSILQSAAYISKSKELASSFSINDNGDLGALIYRKELILNDRVSLIQENIDQFEIIKTVSANYNLMPTDTFIISNKIKYPLLLILLFSVFFFMRYAYKKSEAIAKIS